MRIIIVCVLFFVSVSLAQECEDSIDLHLGTKGPYRLVANKNYDKNDEYDGCVKKIWMIVRHGTRNPNVRHINKMRSHLPLLKEIILEKNVENSKYLVKSDLELFRKWKPRLDEKDEKKLTVEGEYEMIELAERMQARFAAVLSPIYSNTSYKFKFTKTQRTRKSARYFAIGLFGKKTANDVYFPEPSKLDPILRFYKLCTKWRSSVKENPASLDERRKFEQGPVVKEAIAKIGKKLGLQDVLTFDDVLLMYTTCAFETAWNGNKKSAWCVPFDVDTIKVMEYAEDLKYYWVDGYGFDLTYKQACPTFSSMIDYLEDEDPYPKAVLYFSHSGTILKMLSHIGLYKDEEPLRHADYIKNQDRKWRVSKIDSFGTNIAFILHQCKDENKILVLHNENVVRLPCCPDSDLCDLKLVKEYYSESIDNCAFNQMCENDLAEAA